MPRLHLLLALSLLLPACTSRSRSGRTADDDDSVSGDDDDLFQPDDDDASVDDDDTAVDDDDTAVDDDDTTVDDDDTAVDDDDTTVDDDDTTVDDDDTSVDDDDATPPPPAFGDVIINELMMDPLSVDDALGEWLELRNTTAWDINLRGWFLMDDDTDWAVISPNLDLIVPAGAHKVLGVNANALTNGGLLVHWQWQNFQLANTEDEVVLKSPSQVEIARMNYTSSFPTSPGVSTQLDGAITDGLDQQDPSNWCLASTTTAPTFGMGDRGTPGAFNPVCPL